MASPSEEVAIQFGDPMSSTAVKRKHSGRFAAHTDVYSSDVVNSRISSRERVSNVKESK